MSLEYPENLKYTDSHEYISLEGDIATVGISAYAIQQLGDIVFVELPKVGANITKGEPMGTVESVKAVAEVYAPVSGTVLEQNSEIIDDPEIIMGEPYGEGWFIKVKVSNPKDLEDALTADQYSALVSGDH